MATLINRHSKLETALLRGEIRAAANMNFASAGADATSRHTITVLHIGAWQITIWLFVVNFNLIFSISSGSGLDGILIPVLRQAPPVSGHYKRLCYNYT
jgi:hypothetical protein